LGAKRNPIHTYPHFYSSNDAWLTIEEIFISTIPISNQQAASQPQQWLKGEFMQILHNYSFTTTARQICPLFATLGICSQPP
jgi:hypothetical protein